MTKIGELERKVQDRIVKLFVEELRYSYLGNWEKRENNQPIEEEILKANLICRKYKEGLIEKAIFELTKAATVQNKSLYDINKEVYSLLRYGVQVKESHSDNKETVWLIDWKYPEKNQLAIAEEVTVNGRHSKRPDIVIYINGIAVGVLELKRSIVSISEGIRQNLDNQKKDFIQSFFTTVQYVMAGNDSEGLRYGAIGTPEKCFFKWKERGEEDASLDSHLKCLFRPERILELIHDFVLFEAGVKKLCRHNQYYAVKNAQLGINRGEGGIIWHTQGSGKSLIMVWLAKWIRENINNSRVLIITDRDELDKQIEKIFKGVNEQIYRTKSCADLITKLNINEDWFLCSLIHKFGNREEADYEGYIEDISRYLPKDFRAKGDIYVFVDECHRTQSGELHKAMKKLLPDALFIGFTGTPLLKMDKRTSLEVFGRYIDTYKFDEAVFDKAIVDLRYEARDIDQRITSPEKIDVWFDAKTKGLKPLAKAELKRKWSTMQKVLSCRTRLEKIVADIILDMETKDRLQSGRGNAMLVSGSIYEACKYYQLFKEHGFDKCAIVTSYVPNISDIKGETTGDEEITESLFKYDIYKQMLGGQSVEVFEDEAKKRFVAEPGQLKLLIVVDKLLTGFDAPGATYLYIDKKMQDHGLFQAICRVNRVHTDDKEYGYVIDYKDLFMSLECAIQSYTCGAFDNFETEDVQGLLSDRLQKAKERLDNELESIKALCEPVQPPKEEIDYFRYFCGESGNEEELTANEHKRLLLYKSTASLIRAYADVANEMEEAGYTKKETEEIIKDVRYYENVRSYVKLASGDYIDLKTYEPAMRHLIDTYIQAEDSVKVSSFDELGLIELIVQRGESAIDELPEAIKKNAEAVAETIENNVRKLIIDEMPGNPAYFELMSILLDELIKERKALALKYRDYLQKVIDLSKQVLRPELSGRYPLKINTAGKRALYDNLSSDGDLVETLDDEIKRNKKADWCGDLIKEREMKYVISKTVSSREIIERIFELLKEQDEYR